VSACPGSDDRESVVDDACQNVEELRLLDDDVQVVLDVSRDVESSPTQDFVAGAEGVVPER